jgi:hypothetical protein
VEELSISALLYAQGAYLNSEKGGAVVAELVIATNIPPIIYRDRFVIFTSHIAVCKRNYNFPLYDAKKTLTNGPKALAADMSYGAKDRRKRLTRKWTA